MQVAPMTSQTGSKRLISWMGCIHILINMKHPGLGYTEKGERILCSTTIVCLVTLRVFVPSWRISLLSRFPLGWIFKRFDWHLMKRQLGSEGRYGRVCQLMKTKSILVWKNTEPIVIRGGPWRKEIMTSRRVGPIDGQVKRNWARGRTASWEQIYDWCSWVCMPSHHQ